MGKNIGIDLGTANTYICVKNKGIMLREPSVVAIESRTGKVVAVGSEAKLMLGKTPGSITAMRPLKDGVIAEYDAATTMLRHFIHKVSGNTFFSRPRVIVCVPHCVTEVERRAVEEVTLQAGAQSVALIDEPIAAAMGAGINVSDARGNMIVDMGGGTTEVAVISFGGIVYSSSLRIAGDGLDDAIVAYIKKRHNVLIGETTAEQLKIRIGSVFPQVDRGSMEIRGRNLINGLPAILTVSSAEIREAMQGQISHVINCIKNALENTPPELSSDVFDRGIMLTGGGSRLAGLDQLINRVTGVKVRIAKHPLDSVVIGIGITIDKNLGKLVNYKNR